VQEVCVVAKPDQRPAQTSDEIHTLVEDAERHAVVSHEHAVEPIDIDVHRPGGELPRTFSRTPMDRMEPSDRIPLHDVAAVDGRGKDPSSAVSCDCIADVNDLAADRY